MNSAGVKAKELLERLPKGELLRYERAVRRRHPSTLIGPTILGLLMVSIGIPTCFLIMSVMVDFMIERFNSESLWFAALVYAMLIVLPLVLPIAGGVLLARTIRRDLCKTIVRDHIVELRCIFCNYDLTGHAHITSKYITCPECGKDSPRVHVPKDS